MNLYNALEKKRELYGSDILLSNNVNTFASYCNFLSGLSRFMGNAIIKRMILDLTNVISDAKITVVYGGKSSMAFYLVNYQGLRPLIVTYSNRSENNQRTIIKVIEECIYNSMYVFTASNRYKFRTHSLKLVSEKCIYNPTDVSSKFTLEVCWVYSIIK